MSKFKTGKELIQEWKIRDFELFEYVKAGLQPYNQAGKALPPPDISYKRDHIKARLRLLNNKADTLKFYHGWVTLSPEQKKQYFEEDIRRVLWAATHERSAQSEYDQTMKDIESLESELSQIENINSWANYELPEEYQGARAIMDLLLRSYFHIEDINKTLTPVKGQEKAITDTREQKADYEAFIRNLKISLKSGDEIKIQNPPKAPKVYTLEDMGFKNITDKRWCLLIIALNNGGLYRMEVVPKNKVKLAEKVYVTNTASPQTKYDQQQKQLQRLNKRLIDFFNDEFKLQIPKDFKLYKQLSSDPPSHYHFKFNVTKDALEQHEDEYNTYNESGLINETLLLYKKLQNPNISETDHNNLIIRLNTVKSIADQKGFTVKVEDIIKSANDELMDINSEEQETGLRDDENLDDENLNENGSHKKMS